jgi:hypothetical protein
MARPQFIRPTVTVGRRVIMGNVSAVKSALNNLSYTFPDDLNMLLVGPKGQKVFLMGDAGGVRFSHVDLIISDKKSMERRQMHCPMRP